jgi:drug/metabolite transporter (DMT)-like permease
VLIFAGIAAWSLDLLREGRGARVLGVFGLAAGICGMLALCSGALRLDVQGMTVVAVLEAVWTVGAGWLLWQAGGSAGTVPCGPRG